MTTMSAEKGGSCMYRHGWPTQGASYPAAKTIFRTPWSEANILGLTGLSAGRLKLPEDHTGI